MGNTIDTIHGSHYGNNPAPASAGSDDQSAGIFQAVPEEQISGTAQYAAAQGLAKQAHEQYNQAHGGGSTIGNWWYNDRDYLTPEQQKLYDDAQHRNDVERAGNTSAAEVAGREFLKTGSAGTSELAYSAYKYGTSRDQNETWQHTFNENKEDKEAGDRLHPWASWGGTAGGVAAFVGLGWGMAAAKGGTVIAASAAEAAVARGATAVATEAAEGAIAKGTTAIAGRVVAEGAGAVLGDAAAGSAGKGVVEGAADAAAGVGGKGAAKEAVAEVAATVGDRAADEGAAEAAGIAAGNTGRMSPTTFNALLAAVFGGVGGASNNADTPGHALAGGTIGAGMGAALGTGGSKALEAGAPAVSRFASRVVSGKLQAGEPLSPEQLTLIRGAGPPKKGVPPFLPAQFSHSPESVVNDTARLSAKEVNGPRMFNNGKVVPYGFKSAEQYNQAMTELDSAMRASGIEGRIGARGSAVTGVRSPRKPGGGGAFDSGKKISDVDVFIEAKGFLGSKPSEPFTHPDVLQKQYPELGDWSKKWTKQLGRPISVGGWQPGVLPRGGRTSWP